MILERRDIWEPILNDIVIIRLGSTLDVKSKVAKHIGSPEWVAADSAQETLHDILDAEIDGKEIKSLAELEEIYGPVWAMVNLIDPQGYCICG